LSPRPITGRIWNAGGRFASAGSLLSTPEGGAGDEADEMHNQVCTQWSSEPNGWLVELCASHWPELVSDDDEQPAAGRRLQVPSPGADDAGWNRKPSECPDPIELILYVSALSPHSRTAIANIRNVIDRLHSSRVRLTIHDLSKDPSPAEANRVTFTPTLVKRSPGPRTYILGHSTNPELLISLLEECD